MEVKMNKPKRLCADCGKSNSLRHLHLESPKELCNKCYMKTKTEIPNLDKTIKDISMTFNEYEINSLNKKIIEMFGSSKQGFAKYIKYLIEQNINSKPIDDILLLTKYKKRNIYK